MDRDDHRYHLQCWCRWIDVKIQETREVLAASGARLAAQKKRIEARNRRRVRDADPEPPGSAR